MPPGMRSRHMKLVCAGATKNRPWYLVRNTSVPLGNLPSSASALISPKRSSGFFFRLASSSGTSFLPAATCLSCATRCKSLGSASTAAAPPVSGPRLASTPAMKPLRYSCCSVENG